MKTICPGDNRPCDKVPCPFRKGCKENAKGKK
jgi:hypothetical protein